MKICTSFGRYFILTFFFGRKALQRLLLKFPCSCLYLFSLFCRYVLYKEKNMLLTETNLARRHGYNMVQPNRRQKVRKSQGAIKHTLGERKRKKINAHKAYLEELKRFDGLMAKMKLEGDDIEEAMDTEGENLSSEERSEKRNNLIL